MSQRCAHQVADSGVYPIGADDELGGDLFLLDCLRVYIMKGDDIVRVLEAGYTFPSKGLRGSVSGLPGRSIRACCGSVPVEIGT